MRFFRRVSTLSRVRYAEFTAARGGPIIRVIRVIKRWTTSRESIRELIKGTERSERETAREIVAARARNHLPPTRK